MGKQTPGPGAYNLNSGIGRQGLSTRPTSPMSSLHGKIKSSHYQGADKMGPGVCREDSFLSPSSSPNQKWAPRFTMGSKLARQDEDFALGNPGPGTYDHGQFNVVQHKAAQYSMGAKLKGGQRGADVQGPGRCRNDSSMGGQKVSTQKSAPSFSFGGRTKVAGLSVANPDNPGPGAYG